MTSPKNSYLVFGGARGWIGVMLCQMLEAEGKVVNVAHSRLEDRESLLAYVSFSFGSLKAIVAFFVELIFFFI